MNLEHIDGDAPLPESLLKNGVQNIIAENPMKTGKNSSPLFRQLMGCSSPLLCSVAAGTVLGYSSTLLRQLKNDDSVIQVDSSEESWIASITTIALPIACFFAAALMEKYGRRPVMLYTSPLFFVSWMILCFSVNFTTLLIGRFVTGFCTGLVSPVLSVYIGEISQPSHRGLFLAAIGFFGSLGIVIPHTLGLYIKWEMIAVICALIPLLCYVLISIVPESPAWLLRSGQIEEALDAFTWFRGHSDESVDEFRAMVEGQKLSKLRNDSLGFRNIPTFIRTKSFYKPILILVLYSATAQASGPNVIIFYTVTILKDSIGENMNEYLASIILDVTRLLTSIVSCFVIKNVGRRPLTAFSGMATAATLFGLSAYLYRASTDQQLKSLYGIPLALYTLYMVFITIGFTPLVYTLTEELFPLRYRGFGSSFVTLFNYVCAFIAVKISPALFLMLGEQGVYLLFGLCCFVGTTIVMVFLPETQNKTLQEIEDAYGNNSTSVTSIRTKSQNQHHSCIIPSG